MENSEWEIDHMRVIWHYHSFENKKSNVWYVYGLWDNIREDYITTVMCANCKKEFPNYILFQCKLLNS